MGESKKRRGKGKKGKKTKKSNDNERIFHSRKHPRVQLEMEVEYKRGKKFEKALSHNISRGGMFIKSKDPLAEKETTVVKFIIDAEKEPVEVKSRVAWKRESHASPGKQPPGMGVEFIYEDENKRNMVGEFVRDLFDLLRIMAITEKKKTDN